MQTGRQDEQKDDDMPKLVDITLTDDEINQRVNAYVEKCLELENTKLRVLYQDLMDGAKIILEEIGKAELPSRRYLNGRFSDHLFGLMDLKRKYQDVLSYLARGELPEFENRYKPEWYNEVRRGPVSGVEQALDRTDKNYSLKTLLEKIRELECFVFFILLPALDQAICYAHPEIARERFDQARVDSASATFSKEEKYFEKCVRLSDELKLYEKMEANDDHKREAHAALLTRERALGIDDPWARYDKAISHDDLMRFLALYEEQKAFDVALKRQQQIAPLLKIEEERMTLIADRVLQSESSRTVVAPVEKVEAKELAAIAERVKPSNKAAVPSSVSVAPVTIHVSSTTKTLSFLSSVSSGAKQSARVTGLTAQIEQIYEQGSDLIATQLPHVARARKQQELEQLRGVALASLHTLTGNETQTAVTAPLQSFVGEMALKYAKKGKPVSDSFWGFVTSGFRDTSVPPPSRAPHSQSQKPTEVSRRNTV